MTHILNSDVLIVGAGAAGLTLALELARRKIAFRLIDKNDGPFRGSRGKGIQPRSQEVFEDLGILDRIVAAGGVYPPQREYHADGGHHDSPVVEPQEPCAAEPYHMALMVPQFLTETVMRERLAELGHQPQFGCELSAFEQDQQGVTAHLDTPQGRQTLRVAYLVGADGGRSFVRHALGIDFPGKTLGVRAVVADVMLDGIGRDVWHRFNATSMDTQLSLCPLMGTPLFQLQAPVGLAGDVDLSVQGLNAMLHSRSGREDIVIESIAWSSAFTMHARLAQRYRVGRALLTGDAAHIHPPTGGQGLNTSIQDAYNLGWKLAAVLGGAAQALLDTYEEERRPVAQQMLGLATTLLAKASHAGMRRGREVQQLDIGYAGASLALLNRAPGATLLAGERAPDAPCRGAGGQPRRLFDLFQGPHWTLLVFQPAPEAPRPAVRPGLHRHIIGADILDHAGHIQAAYGLAAGDWVLVRPDGYIGAIVASHQIAALEAYLDMVIGGQP